MSNRESTEAGGVAPAQSVVVGFQASGEPRVVAEAAKYAALHGVRLLVVSVDTTRFVNVPDPDGYVPPIPREVDTGAVARELTVVSGVAARELASFAGEWEVVQLIGDPADSIKRFAAEQNAVMIVVGTRKRGLGESIREFFTGSVAARLAHKQAIPVLVVPLSDPAADGEDLWPDVN